MAARETAAFFACDENMLAEAKAIIAQAPETSVFEAPAPYFDFFERILPSGDDVSDSVGVNAAKGKTKTPKPKAKDPKTPASKAKSRAAASKSNKKKKPQSSSKPKAAGSSKKKRKS